MSSTFKFHSQVQETVPWNATYSFPSQATKVSKQIVKLPPKNGSSFTNTQIMRIEFPSDNYLNMLNSYLSMQVTWTPNGATRLAFERGGAHNLIKRLRILYGSLPLEDIQEYKTLVRIFSECAIPHDYRESYGGILDGMSANMSNEFTGDDTVPAGANLVNSGVIEYKGTLTGTPSTGFFQLNSTGKPLATANIEGLDISVYTASIAATQVGTIRSYDGTTITLEAAFKTAPASTDTYTIRLPTDFVADTVGYQVGGAFENASAPYYAKTFCLNLLSGLMTCKKLIPLKWMAAQLAIEITFANPGEVALYDTGTPSYTVGNVNFVAEMVEFDSTYDAAFYMGLQQSGVPLKFSSWHYHTFSLPGSNTVAQIHERARSVKAAFAVVRDQNAVAGTGLLDSGRFFHAPGQAWSTSTGLLDSTTTQQGQIYQFQWRVGGRYFPAQPVQSLNGGAEALVELLKAVGYFGNYTEGGAINYRNWTTSQNGCIGDKFIMAAEFENTDAVPNTIAGINAEEQSDIALTINMNAVSGNGVLTNKQLDVFMHYDSLIIVRDGNTVDLIL